MGFAGKARAASASVRCSRRERHRQDDGAEVLAREMQLDLYRIDLSAVVNKYIGETKRTAPGVRCRGRQRRILLFDEADALSASAAKSRTARPHANIEVSYLLQRMESYRGLPFSPPPEAALDFAFQRACASSCISVSGSGPA